GDFDRDSDVDLFIDVDEKDEKNITKAAERALKKFYSIEGDKWRLREVKQQISLKIGNLDQWQLKNSIEKEGIVLYSQTSISIIPISSSLSKYIMLTFEPIHNPKKRIKVIRKLFGRNEQNYIEKGLVNAFEGKIISPRSFMVKPEGLQQIASFLSKEKVKFSFEEIWK
ncbi:hypothetical protein HYY69_02925, partial [Candidatus Woesearchaeota archaeon]|nr:hypothetical protein [Candidatus Woesearchaeota archaeon]